MGRTEQAAECFSLPVLSFLQQMIGEGKMISFSTTIILLVGVPSHQFSVRKTARKRLRRSMSREKNSTSSKLPTHPAWSVSLQPCFTEKSAAVHGSVTIIAHLAFQNNLVRVSETAEHEHIPISSIKDRNISL